MDKPATKYSERLRITWFLFWRLTLMAVAVAFIWGYVVGFSWERLGIPVEVARVIAAAGAYVITVVVIGPLLVWMLVRKSFKGFRMKLVRGSK